MNKIGAFIIHKRSENMNGQYCIDQSKYSHSMIFKTDYKFVCCDINSNGILFGSRPVDDISESIIKYKPILRDNKYIIFCSEKDCEWTYLLPINEICVSVGVTNKYVIVTSNERYLWILSVGGLQ